MLIFRSSLMCRKSVTEPMAMDRVGRRALHACSSTESVPEGQCGRVLSDWSEVCPRIKSRLIALLHSE